MRKVGRKIISIVLIVCFSMLSVSAFAKDHDDKLKKKEIEKQKSIVQEIASGTSDTLVGEGVAFDNPVPEGTVQTDWASGGSNHTHQFLAARGITIIENDKTWSVAQHLYESNGTSIILEYADKPDSIETDTSTFAGHFYNPTDGYNWQGYTNPTALSRFCDHYTNAKSYFTSNKTLAWQELGMAIHYLSDLNETHHAANLIAVVTNHTQYESWADQNRFNYGITTCDSDTYNSIRYFLTLKGIIDDCANNAKSYQYSATTDTSTYPNAAAPTLAKAQKTIAAVLYRFLSEVGEI